MKILKVYIGLKRDIYILGVFRLIVGMGYFVIPYLSIYLTDELGISVSKAGLIIAAANIFCIPMLTLGGLLTKRYLPEHIVIGSQLLTAFSYISVIIVPNIESKVILSILGFGFSNFTTPAFDACIGMYAKKEERQKAFSLMYLCLNIGVAIGSLIVGSLYKINPNIIFVGNAVAVLIGIGILSSYFFHTKSTRKEMQEYSEVVSKCVESKEKKRFSLDKKVIFCIVFINALIYGQVSFLLPLYLNENLIDNGTVIYGILMTVNAIGVIVISPIATQIFAKHRLIAAILFAELFFMVGYGTYAVSNSVAIIVLSTILWTAGEVLFSVHQIPYLIKGEEKNRVGIISAFASAFNKAGSILSSLLGASLIYIMGYNKSWILISMLAGFATVLCLILYKKNR